mmetsp:Transcript_25846/g.60175  ORF Transcript_25846/g.60175 Transcript_25846/m.60175 type:complete len:115 (+) Transcript_25846:892-1236(+)
MVTQAKGTMLTLNRMLGTRPISKPQKGPTPMPREAQQPFTIIVGGNEYLGRHSVLMTIKTWVHRPKQAPVSNLDQNSSGIEAVLTMPKSVRSSTMVNTPAPSTPEAKASDKSLQ